MPNVSCNVCGSEMDRTLYGSAGNQSLTSLCQVYTGITKVRACGTCGHLQTDAINNVEAYYDNDYTILMDSEEEDQIYEIRNGVTTFRTAHQVETLLNKVGLPAGALLLDYGCAKSSTIKALIRERTNIVPHLFDVSERFIPFWECFCDFGNWATYRVKESWSEKFDIVTSFFSFEHIVHPCNAIREITGLLKPGGIFYCVVPNVLTNTADFIVVDHVNHFTAPSLARMLNGAGLEIVDIDDTSHRGAFVVIGRKPELNIRAPNKAAKVSPENVIQEIEEIASFWQRATERIREFERSIPNGEAGVAIYGAGFYGSFVFSCLENPDNIKVFLDQNPFLQGREHYNRPIVPPSALSECVETVLVGLNPTHARNVIADIEALQQRTLNFFFL